VIPPAEKADIISSNTNDSDHAEISVDTTLPFETVVRRLVPKRKSKDQVLTETVKYYEHFTEGKRGRIAELRVSTDWVGMQYRLHIRRKGDLYSQHWLFHRPVTSLLLSQGKSKKLCLFHDLTNWLIGYGLWIHLYNDYNGWWQVTVYDEKRRNWTVFFY
jgi:hypothetical protein